MKVKMMETVISLRNKRSRKGKERQEEQDEDGMRKIFGKGEGRSREQRGMGVWGKKGGKEGRNLMEKKNYGKQC